MEKKKKKEQGKQPSGEENSCQQSALTTWFEIQGSTWFDCYYGARGDKNKLKQRERQREIKRSNQKHISLSVPSVFIPDGGGHRHVNEH